MPPKGSKASAKGKAKAQVKAKGKSKAKAKGKAKAKAGKPAETDRDVAPEAAVGEGEGSSEPKKPKAKAKASAAAKRILDAAAGKPFDEAIKEAKRRLHGFDAAVAEAAALEEAQSSQATAARKELDQASKEIRELIEEENACLQRRAQVQLANVKAAAEVDNNKRALLEAKQALSLLEVEAARKQKRQAAENLQQTTKAAIAKVQALKGVGRRSVCKSADAESTPTKRESTASSRSAKSAAPDEADTLPATLQDNADDMA